MKNTDLEEAPRPLRVVDNSLNHTHSHTGGEIKKRGRGRPKGSKNGRALLQAAINEDWTRLAKRRSRKVFEVLSEKAIEGEPWAVKLFMDKILPNAQPKDQPRDKGFGGVQIIINDIKSEDDKTIEGEVVED
jgi:hypothetical protein